jgi:hypothetical protein
MAEGIKREGSSGLQQTDRLIDYQRLEHIRDIARHNARTEIYTEEQLLLFLQSWWSRTYSRPLKDPLLLKYSLEELLYEFYDRIERQEAERDRVKREADKIEEEKEKSVLDWAAEEEKRELEREARKANQSTSKNSSEPTQQQIDSQNKKWVDEQIARAKQEIDPSFGEDLNLTIEEE